MSQYDSTDARSTPDGRAAEYSSKPLLELKRLPKEFRKSIFADFDRSFLMILVVSLVLHIILVNYFAKHLASRPETAMIPDIQQTYAKLLLDDTFVEPLRDERPISATDISSPSWALPPIESEGYGDVGSTAARGFTPSAEAMLPTAEAMNNEARASAEIRAGRRVARAERVRELGLFFIIGSGGSGAIDYEAMDRLFNASAENVGHLGEVLSKLDALSIPRFGAKGFRGGTVSVNMDDLRGDRAGRPELEIAALVNDVEPLAEVVETPVERNEEFEEIESTIAEKPSDEELVGLTRSPEDVSRIILSHQSTIQDCYKSVLKNNQQIQGEISVRFWVNYEGRVVDAVILSSTVNNQDLENCVLRRMKRWNDFGYADPAKGNLVYRQTYQFGY